MASILRQRQILQGKFEVLCITFPLFPKFETFLRWMCLKGELKKLLKCLSLKSTKTFISRFAQQSSMFFNQFDFKRNQQTTIDNIA